MSELFRRLTFTVTALSILIHLATFIPSIPVAMWWAWPLHIGAIGCAIGMALTIARMTGQLQGEPGTHPLTWVLGRNRSARPVLRLMLEHVPGRVLALCVAAFVYAIVNFGLFMLHTEGGSPAYQDDTYYLSNHGTKIRDLTPQEYEQMQAYEVRGFSGHWILASLLTAVFLIYVEPTASRSLTPSRRQGQP